MLLKRRPPRIDDKPTEPARGFEHLDPQALAVLRWLRSAGVEFVLVGPMAAALRGQSSARGAVAIVPSPYRRNFERLERALGAERLYARVDEAGPGGEADLTPTKLTSEMLARSQLRTLRLGTHDLDIEGSASGMPSYQDLLYEASRFDPAPDLSVEVASPEDIERYAHVRRTGMAPEITIWRQGSLEPESERGSESEREQSA